MSKQINLKKFTWDYPERDISEREFLNCPELISRVLKYGDIEEWAWLVKKIGKKGLSDFLKNNAYKLDDRTFNWWRIYCGFDYTFPKTRRGIGEIEEINPLK